MKNVILFQDGRKAEVKPKDGADEFKFEDLQKIVGGYIQVLYLPDSSIILTDEDGRAKGKKLNEAGTELLAGTQYAGQYLVGDVIHCDFSVLK